MSLMAMSRAAKKHGWLVGAVMAFLMVGGVVLTGLGSNLGGGRGPMNAPGAQTAATVATVGDRKLTSDELDRLANDAVKRMAAQNPMMPDQRPTPDEMERYRLEALESVKQQQALIQVAKASKITLTDADITAERQKQWTATVRPAIAGQLGLDATASDDKVSDAIAKTNPSVTLDALKLDYLPDDQIRLSLMVQRLQALYKSQIGADEAAVRKSLSDMTVRHILVKFGAGALPEAQAQVKAQKLLDAVKADPTKMGALATANSDDPGSQKNGGVYNWAPSERRSIVPEFSAALDTLQPGQTYPELVRVSNSGYSGFHIIRLESVKEGKEFPKDFATNKAKYLDDYVQAHVDQRIQKAVDAAVPIVPVTLTDPMLLAEQSFEDAMKSGDPKERDDKLKQTLTLLDKVKKDSDPLGIAPVRRGQIDTVLKQPKDAIAAYVDALTYRNAPETRLALAQQYMADKQPDKVQEQLTAIEGGVIPDSNMEEAISTLYQQIGDKDKAAAAKKKASEMQQRQMQAFLQQYQQKQGAAGLPAAPAAPATSAPKGTKVQVNVPAQPAK